MTIRFFYSNLQKNISFFLSAILLMSNFQILAQSTKAQIRKGNKYVRKENYLRALPIFEKVLESNPDNTKAIYKSGVCYLHRYSKEKGLENIKKSIETDPKIDKHANYWMGRALQLNYKFDEAKEYYDKYAATLKKRDSRRDDVKKHIEQCETGKEMIKNPGEFYLENLGPKINSKYSDHSPVLNDDGTTLLFTSRKETSTGNVETMTGEFFEDIYVSEKKDNEWGPLSHIGDQLNTTGHDACSHLFENGKKLLMYRSTRNGDIYLTEKENGSWGIPQRFPVINSGSYESSAFMAHDGKRVYFSTNRYSDGGDLDFYYSDLQADSTWGAPEELGAGINTNDEEDGLYITKDGKYLYFSSRGHKGMGGFDVFRCEWEGNKWGKPVNLGHPLNTPDDDVYFYLCEGTNRAYLSSYRDGGYGEKDIYMAAPIAKVNLLAMVKDSLSQKPISDEQVKISFKAENDSLNKFSASTTLSNSNLNLLVQSRKTYEVVFEKEGAIIYKTKLEVPVVLDEGKSFESSFTIPYYKDSLAAGLKDLTPKIAKVEPKIDTAVITKDYIFGNVYFEKNISKINPAYWPFLKKLIALMKEHKEIKIEIQGFSDEDGDENYNKKLSELRAHNVYDYIVSRGISTKRVIFKGYGMTKKFGDGSSETEKMQNRRVEFVKIN